MKTVNRSLFIFCCLSLVVFTGFLSNPAQTSPRIRYTINDNWHFLNKDVAGGERRVVSDGDWEKVSLPHTWNALDAFDDEPGYRRGPGWYRRELRLSPDLKGKRIFLYFEGANQTAEVFCNEKRLGKHIGGFSAFVFDVTDVVEFDKPVLVAVRVDNTLEKDIPPLDADFTMYGGIYRDVWLIAADEVHFKIANQKGCVPIVPPGNSGTSGTGGTLLSECSHASTGVKIETPVVSAESGSVKISGTVTNAGDNAKIVAITSSILDSENRTIAVTDSKLTVAPRSEADFLHAPVRINKPRLWSPDDPYLYRVQTVIRENGKTLDENSNPLGFRWFKFDAEQGFFLNGKPMKLRGTNRHQDYAGLGNAVPDALHVRDLEIIKDNGFNFLRLAHYPQDPSVLETADRLGLLIWEEIPIVNLITISETFNENSKTMLTDMIRQHRNHPSIIIWGYMNEVFLRSPKTDADLTETAKLAKELEKICKIEDPGRATAIAFDSGARENYYKSGLAEVTDVVGWNLYFGWYNDTFPDFGKFIDEQHRRLPNRPFIISEYGANADQRLHSLTAKRFDSTIEWQRMFHEAYLPQINARRFLAGSAIWSQFDFGSEFRGETIPHINQKGMFTYHRKPKDISYFYKASFSKERVLHIATRDWQHRSGPLNQPIDVYTNFPSVELFQNGASLGIRSAVNRKASWNVNLSEGKNTFAARAAEAKTSSADTADVYFSGRTVFDNSFREIAVNAGSNADFVDDGNAVWAADQSYKKGSWGSVGSDLKAISTGRNILGTLDDPLYQTMLSGPVKYRFDVPDGDYEIELRFVEPEFKNAGKRVFDIKFNQRTFMGNTDLVIEAGYLQSYARKVRTIASGREGLLIELIPRAGSPVLSGIRVKRVL